jgi:hypothetical protein
MTGFTTSRISTAGMRGTKELVFDDVEVPLITCWVKKGAACAF